VAEGFACDKTLQDCAPNLACPGTKCVRAQVKSMGDRCGYLPDGSWAVCGAGLHCVSRSLPGYYECVPAQDAGTPCGYDDECDVGLKCIEGTCGVLDAARCVAPLGATANPTYPARTPAPPQLAPSQAAAVVLTAPKVVSITFDSDPNQAAYDDFIAALSGSSLWHMTTQEYGVGPLAALPPVHASAPPRSPVSNAQIRDWLTAEIDAGIAPPSDGQTIYTVVVPPGTVVTGDGQTSCVDFLGYHDEMEVQGVPTPYAVIAACQLGPLTATAVHEAVEAATDPFYDPNGGYDSVDDDHIAWAVFGGELETGDMCESTPYARFSDPEMGKAAVQRTWSNAAIAAMHDPCVPAVVGQPFLAAVPETPDTVSVVFDGTTTKTKGISIPLGTSRTISVDLLSDGPIDGPWYVSAVDLGRWNHHDPLLQFSFDKQFGLNGDHLMLTITALAKDSAYKAEPFVLVSRRGRNAHYWFATVGNP
jgi:hypothetical protein